MMLSECQTGYYPRVIVGLMKGDAVLFRQPQANDGLRRLLAAKVFGMTYEGAAA